MRFWRELSTRILVVSAGCGLIGVASSQIIRRASRDSLVVPNLSYVREAVSAKELARCESAPDQWRLQLEGGVQVDAYDGRTLEPHNPSALPPDPRLIHRLLEGEEHPSRVYQFGDREAGALLLRTGLGPCGVVQVAWPPQKIWNRRTYLLLAVLALGMSLTAAVGFAALIRPLARRVESLRRAANLVGATDGYVGAERGVDDELGDVASSLDRAHERIRADAVRLEDRRLELERYLEDVAHDLRTPVASLRVVLEQAADLNKTSESRELINAALKDTIYLAGLINNLRLASRIRGGWDPTAGNPRCDLTEIVERVVERQRIFARRREVSVEAARPDTPLWVRLDSTAVEQAINNVVENAVTHGQAGGHVAVILDAAHDERFSLTVVDDGSGVPPAELPRLGERTFRSDEARQRDPEGRGLGLAIVIEICTRAGWEVGFTASEPRGLRVRIEGPRSVSSAPLGDA